MSDDRWLILHVAEVDGYQKLVADDEGEPNGIIWPPNRPLAPVTVHAKLALEMYEAKKREDGADELYLKGKNKELANRLQEDGDRHLEVMRLDREATRGVNTVSNLRICWLNPKSSPQRKLLRRSYVSH